MSLSGHINLWRSSAELPRKLMIHPNYDFHRQISLFVGRSTPTPSSLHGGVPLVCSLHLPWISKAWLGVAINFTWKVSPNLGGYRMLITQHECNFYKSLVFLVKLLDRKYLFNSLFNWWLDIISNLKFCQLKKKIKNHPLVLCTSVFIQLSCQFRHTPVRIQKRGARDV